MSRVIVRKSGGWGDSGRIPQTNTLLLHSWSSLQLSTINELDEKVLEKMEMNLRVIVTVIRIDVCGESC